MEQTFPSAKRKRADHTQRYEPYGRRRNRSARENQGDSEDSYFYETSSDSDIDMAAAHPTAWDTSGFELTSMPHPPIYEASADNDIEMTVADARSEEEETDELSPLEKGERALELLKKLVRRAKETGQDTTSVEAHFDRLKKRFDMQWIHFAQDSSIRDAPLSIRFKINPEFELELSGGHAIEMRSEGSNPGSTQTRVRWEPQTLDLKTATHTGGSYTTGKHMMAMPLSQDHATGTLAKADSDHKPMMKKLPALGNNITGATGGSGNLYYIHGHLLNDNLGGIANEANLFPITHEANRQHKNHVEEYIKKGMDKGYVYRYEVFVDNISVDYNTSPVTTTGTPLNLFTVDSDLNFRFARLDTAGNDVTGTEHSGKIKSRYGAKGTAPFVNTTEYATDYTGGKYNSPVDVGAGANKEALDTTKQKVPASSNAGLTDDITATGFTYGVPSDPGIWASSASISSTASLIPVGKKLSLRKSAKSNVVTYFDNWVPAWKNSDIDKWVDDVRTNSMTRWKDVFDNATKSHNLAVGTEGQLRKAHALTRVSINGAKKNT